MQTVYVQDFLNMHFLRERKLNGVCAAFLKNIFLEKLCRRCMCKTCGWGRWLGSLQLTLSTHLSSAMAEGHHSDWHLKQIMEFQELRWNLGNFSENLEHMTPFCLQEFKRLGLLRDRRSSSDPEWSCG